MSSRPTPHMLRRIAVGAECCEQSIGRYFRGGRMQPMTRARIERALNVLDLAHLIRRGPGHVDVQGPPGILPGAGEGERE